MGMGAFVPRWVLAAGLSCACALAQAHDTWFSVASPATAGGPVALHLGTGTRYPLASSAPAATDLAQAACAGASGAARPLRPGQQDATALALRASRSGAAPLACWMELKAHEITLDPPLVDVYLREIQPPAEVRQAWAAQHEAGRPWQERYRKFARIELAGPDATPEQLRAIRRPRGLDLEIVVLGDAPLRSGQPARFQVLARGVPVAGLAVELVSERSPLGVWGRSDGNGEVAHTLPFGGAWLLRATLLEPDVAPGAWRSRFVTLAFEAQL
jgi:hypothetical protein